MFKINNISIDPAEFRTLAEMEQYKQQLKKAINSIAPDRGPVSVYLKYTEHADPILTPGNIEHSPAKCESCNGKGYKTPDRIHSINCSECKGTGKQTNNH